MYMIILFVVYFYSNSMHTAKKNISLHVACVHVGMCPGSNTLHARRSKLLSGKEDGVIVILCVVLVLFLLQKSPAAHVLQTLRRVP